MLPRRIALLLAPVLVLTALSAVGPGTATAAACDNAPLPSPAPTVKVLVVGDSLSAGSAGDFTWRYRFWQYERAQGVNIDFVGSITGLMGTWDTPVANNDDYADPCFNQREDFAVGGMAMSQTLTPSPYSQCTDGQPYTGTQVAWETYCYQPDVVLDFMGFNDLKAKADNGQGETPDELVANARTFVAETQKAKPGVLVGVATVGSTQPPLVIVNGASYNSKLATAVTDMQSQSLPVGLVDITPDWSFATAQTWDGYHPNANGEMSLAWAISRGLAALPGSHVVDLHAKIPTIPRQPLGPRSPGTVSVADHTDSSADLTWTFPTGADREILYRRDLTTGSEWTKVLDERYATGETETGLSPHLYQFRIRAAKGTAVAQTSTFEPLYSKPVALDLRRTLSIELVSGAAVRHGVSITWAPARAATGYVVRWRRSGTKPWSGHRTTQLAARVTGLAAGARYQVEVAATRGSTTGASSRVLSLVPSGTVNPAVPRPVVRYATRHRLRISWNRAPAATRYQVLFRTGGGGWHTLAWTAGTRMTSRSLVRGRSYAIAVVAWDSYVAGRTSSAAVARVR
ncbi:MAG: fibronectin type III domain-containing protein [Marmoricola sp.]